jgi:hypothetical protein
LPTTCDDGIGRKEGSRPIHDKRRQLAVIRRGGDCAIDREKVDQPLS